VEEMQEMYDFIFYSGGIAAEPGPLRKVIVF